MLKLLKKLFRKLFGLEDYTVSCDYLNASKTIYFNTLLNTHMDEYGLYPEAEYEIQSPLGTPIHINRTNIVSPGNILGLNVAPVRLVGGSASLATTAASFGSTVGQNITTGIGHTHTAVDAHLDHLSGSVSRGSSTVVSAMASSDSAANFTGDVVNLLLTNNMNDAGTSGFLTAIKVSSIGSRPYRHFLHVPDRGGFVIPKSVATTALAQQCLQCNIGGLVCYIPLYTAVAPDEANEEQK